MDLDDPQADGPTPIAAPAGTASGTSGAARAAGPPATPANPVGTEPSMGATDHRGPGPTGAVPGDTGAPSGSPVPPGPDVFLVLVVLGAAAVMLVAGAWALLDPGGFADAVAFPANEHFVHDTGAFQIGIGLTLLLALVWRDPPAVVLAAFLVGNTVHAANHGTDLHLGGRSSDPWALALLSALVAVALVRRLRQLGYVVGHVEGATDRALAPFVQQKTVLVTTYRRDGTGVATPVSLAVDGDRAYVRSFRRAGKTRRIAHDGRVAVAPSTARGRPVGAAVPADARRLDNAEAARARHLLARKHPLLHGVVVPLAHRVGRARTGRTVHFEVTARPAPS